MKPMKIVNYFDQIFSTFSRKIYIHNKFKPKSSILNKTENQGSLSFANKKIPVAKCACYQK